MELSGISKQIKTDQHRPISMALIGMYVHTDIQIHGHNHFKNTFWFQASTSTNGLITQILPIGQEQFFLRTTHSIEELYVYRKHLNNNSLP